MTKPASESEVEGFKEAVEPVRSSQATPLSPHEPFEPAGKPVFAPYNPPAGGGGALRATAGALREQSIVLKGSETLLSMNQPDGFDCPGCACIATPGAGAVGI